MAEAASVVGEEIGRPGLAYKQLPDDVLRKALTDTGMSQNVANLLLEMYRGAQFRTHGCTR